MFKNLEKDFSVGLLSGICIGFLLNYLFRKNLLSNFYKNNNKASFGSVLNTIKLMSKKTKLILVVRNDLKMGKGKIAAQCSHASVMAYCKAKKHQSVILRNWELSGQMKVVVKIDNEQNLFEIKKKAEEMGLLTNLVQDAGHTQVDPNTYTVLAVGPGSKSTIDQITGHLQLL